MIPFGRERYKQDEHVRYMMNKTLEKPVNLLNSLTKLILLFIISHISLNIIIILNLFNQNIII